MASWTKDVESRIFWSTFQKAFVILATLFSIARWVVKKTFSLAKIISFCKNDFYPTANIPTLEDYGGNSPI